MIRFFVHWLVLAPVAIVVTYGVSIGLFRHADLSFAQFATLLVAPIAQAAALTWPGRAARGRIAAALRAVASHPFALPVVALDALLLGGGLIAWGHHLVGLGAASGIHPIWIGVKAAAAATFFVHAAGAALRSRARVRRLPLLTFPVLLVAVAAEALLPWTNPLFGYARMLMPGVPEVAQRLVLYGALFTAGITITLAAGHGIAQVSGHAKVYVELAVVLALAAAVVVVLATFNMSVLLQPWKGAAQLFASGAASCALHAALLAASPPSPRGATVAVPS